MSRRTLFMAVCAVALLALAGLTFTLTTPPSTPSPKTTQPTPATGVMGLDAHPDWVTFKGKNADFTLRHPPAIDEIDLGTGEIHVGKDAWISVRALPSTYTWNEGCPETPTLDERVMSAERVTLNGTDFCYSHEAEGAAGSTYETYEYVTKTTSGYIAIHFVARHVTDVRIYGGCEREEDLQKEECRQLQWNEERDTAIFKEILKTLTAS